VKRLYDAPFVGEPTGGAPQGFGEIKSFRLPHCGMEVYYSTKYFRLTEDEGPSFQPDYLVERTFEDYRTGRDPVWEKVLELVTRDSPPPSPPR